MNADKKNERIIILTDRGNTFKPDYSKKEKVKDVYGGSFLEIRGYYEKVKELHEETSMFALVSEDVFINSEAEYSTIEKGLARESLEDIFRYDHQNIILVLKRRSFDVIYENGLKDMVPYLRDTRIFLVGASTIKSRLIVEEKWDKNWYFFKRVGVARIGRENQKRILRSLGLEAEL